MILHFLLLSIIYKLFGNVESFRKITSPHLTNFTNVKARYTKTVSIADGETCPFVTMRAKR